VAIPARTIRAFHVELFVLVPRGNTPRSEVD
jgi:hypothetical protein